LRSPERSPTSLIADAGAEPAGPIVSTSPIYYGDAISVVFDGWKLIHRYGEAPDVLYSLAADERESKSVADSNVALLSEGIRLIEARANSTEALREQLGLRDEAGAELSPDMLRDLRALGYIR
jgi:hypothetical protein